MIRLYIVGEGTTEAGFATQALKPHLESLSGFQIQVEAPNLRGHKTYAEIKKFVKNLLAAPTARVIVTTMIDLFKLPPDFPGRTESIEDPLRRVATISGLFEEDMADRRFIPYLQLHEFEALIVSELSVLVDRHPNREREIRELEKRLAKFPTPEHVNRLKPPSYWIGEAVPEYKKPLDGIIAAEAIGLDALRERCPHFGGWLGSLEAVAKAALLGSREEIGG